MAIHQARIEYKSWEFKSKFVIGRKKNREEEGDLFFASSTIQLSLCLRGGYI